ncbi:hypothetical protein [Anoxybacillus sp. CHMUD]|nr:hypothetical protein [Anoxybacillus sp. CHMUD]
MPSWFKIDTPIDFYPPTGRLSLMRRKSYILFLKRKE